jgi:hypothetical protein
VYYNKKHPHGSNYFKVVMIVPFLIIPGFVRPISFFLIPEIEIDTRKWESLLTENANGIFN